MSTDSKQEKQDEVKDEQLNEASGGSTNCPYDDDQIVEDSSRYDGRFRA